MELFTSEEIENIFKNKFKKFLFFNEIKINSRLKSNNSLFIPIKGKNLMVTTLFTKHLKTELLPH